MKKILRLWKVFLLLGLIAMIFIPSLNIQVDAASPRDPHEHIGTATLCHNTSSRACDAPAY